VVCVWLCRQIPFLINLRARSMSLDFSMPPASVRSRRVAAGVFMVVTVLLALWTVGPRPTFVERWKEPQLPDDLDAWATQREVGVPDLREGDGRTIVWADPEVRERTPLSLVYLHGFSADRHEMEPVISHLGADLGANVFFTRLAGHGRDGAAMAEATVEDWLADAVEALAVGARLGDQVVLIGTSTGGTLASWLVARPEAGDRVAAMILVSPNFHPKDRNSRVFLQPWGEKIAGLVVGKERCWEPMNQAQQQHWTTCYPIEAITPMMALVERVRTMDLSSVTVPTLGIYSPDDDVVDARETDARMATLTGAHVITVDVPSATDPSHHVLAGDIVSPESNEHVRRLMVGFLREQLAETMAGPRNE